MRVGVLCLFLCIAQVNFALGQGSFGVGAQLSRVITYNIQIETRIGYLDCDLQRQGKAEAEVVACTDADGEMVSMEQLISMGLVEAPEEEENDNEG